MVYILLAILFVINPFLAFLVSIFFLFKVKLDNKQQIFCLLAISLFMGVLAFTQKSLCAVGTDCVRYYSGLKPYVGKDPLLIFGSMNPKEMLNFVFYPVSIFLVALTGNVQIVSFFWVATTYLLTFLSIKELTDHYLGDDQKTLAKLVVALLFCFCFFVEITDLLKNSSAFAVFFYGYTLFVTGKGKGMSILFAFLAIGIHSSAIMLLPLYLYKVVSLRWMTLAAIAVSTLSVTTNFIKMFMKLLPDTTYFNLLMNRFGTYSEENTTPFYVGLQLMMIGSALYLFFRCSDDKSVRNVLKIVLLYIVISFLNYYNLTAYKRFSLFSQWMFGLILINYICKSELLDVRRVQCFLLTVMFMMMLRYSMGRTIGGGYSSSYMDNSLTKLVVSPLEDYLIVRYDK